MVCCLCEMLVVVVEKWDGILIDLECRMWVELVGGGYGCWLVFVGVCLIYNMLKCVCCGVLVLYW